MIHKHARIKKHTFNFFFNVAKRAIDISSYQEYALMHFMCSTFHTPHINFVCIGSIILCNLVCMMFIALLLSG